MIRKIFANDNRRAFTPIFIPGETYSFVMNEGPFTDTEGLDQFLILQLYRASDDSLAAAYIPRLIPVLLASFGSLPGNANPYYLYAVFTFPNVPIGEYYFTITSNQTGEIKARSNVVICEPDCFETTALIKYRNSYDLYNIPYSILPDNFYNIMRLPLTQVKITAESEKKQYRNASDHRFRNVRSYLDYGYTLSFVNLDEAMYKTLSQVLEHDFISVNNEIITPKTSLTDDQGTPQTIFNPAASFDCYINQEQYPQYSLELHGNKIFYGGGFANLLKADIIIDAQII